jgi:hypothetical protein
VHDFWSIFFFFSNIALDSFLFRSLFDLVFGLVIIRFNKCQILPKKPATEVEQNDSPHQSEKLTKTSEKPSYNKSCVTWSKTSSKTQTRWPKSTMTMPSRSPKGNPAEEKIKNVSTKEPRRKII